MEPSRPELYLDPLLPLHVRRDPVAFPRLAHAGARGILICSAGGYTIVEGANRTTLASPALMRVDLSAGVRLARGGGRSGDGSNPERPATRGWLIVIGGRLLDQLIVGTFGDPGFSRFLDELDSPGRSACDSLDDELDLGLTELGAELAERRPAYRVRARSLLTSVLLLLYRSTLMTPELSNGDGIREMRSISHEGVGGTRRWPPSASADGPGEALHHHADGGGAGVGHADALLLEPAAAAVLRLHRLGPLQRRHALLQGFQ